MTRQVTTPSTSSGRELERALQDWIAASRRAYDAERAPADVRAEELAWRRVASVLQAAGHAPVAA